MKLDTAFKEIEKSLSSYVPTVTVERVGRIRTIADGVAKITGLDAVAVGELLEFKNGIYGLTLNLEENEIGVVILGNYLKLKQGDEAKGTGRLLSIPVSDEFIGRVVDPLGKPLDGKSEIKTKRYIPLERVAPGVVEREPVNTPIQTGIKAIDSMIPVGRGQRELIIGDRGTGKTAIAIDTIINQRNEKSGIVCIYVAIGQKTSRVAQVIETLKQYKSMEQTIVVSADSSTPAALKFLAPYAGCALGEYFMEKGKDAVIFYDDLTKHAWAYREVSLILRRPSGREAYPGDIFYLHSRLLERACKLNKKLGGGSLTAFPIIETQAGDISAYIPTNVISITDGQIYLESDLFYSGIRPAINIGLSVSRVGGSAQVPAMKKVAGRLRLDLAQYRELSAFVQFASDLDEKTKERIDQGSKMVELLKQGLHKPLPIEKQIALVWVGTSELLKEVPVSLIKQFENDYLDYIENLGKGVLSDLRKENKMSDAIVKKLETSTKSFLEQWQPLKQSKKE